MTDTTMQHLATRLAHHQWRSDPEYPLLHEPSAHHNHIYNGDCAICRHDLPRIVGVLLDALAADGLLLPPATETVEQFGVRVYRDGQLMDESDPPVSRERAQARVDWHTREREQNPDWLGHAVLVRRHQHTTPWTPVEEQP